MGGSLMTIAMVAMMALMMGGMVIGGAWVFLRRRKRHDD
jgi:hypothetical protein